MGPSIIDVLGKRVAPDGSLTLLNRDGEQTESYLAILEKAVELGGRLAAGGVEPGMRVGLLAVPTFEFVTSLLAALAANACCVLLPPPAYQGKKLWARQTATMLRQADVAWTLGVPFTTDSPVPHIDTKRLPAGTLLPEVDDRSDAMILFTSGTTGDPRGVIMSKGAVSRRLELDAQQERYEADDRFFSWRPLSSSAGIFPGLLTPFAMGASGCVMDSAIFARAPQEWPLQVSQRRATVSGGPNFAYGAVAQRFAAGLGKELDLSCWRVAECAGERIDPVTVADFIERASPHGFEPTSFTPLYALTEAGIITSGSRGEGLTTEQVDLDDLGRGVARPGGDRSRLVVSSGSIRPGVSVEVGDDRGEALADRHVGEIFVRSPCLTSGYVGAPEETGRRLRDGRFQTGDLGYVAEGRLYITGRSKNLIIVRGRNYSGDELERSVQELGGVIPGSAAVVAIPRKGTEEVAVYVESEAVGDRRESISRTIRAKLWIDFGLATKVYVSEPGSLPRTSVGKLARETLRSHHAAM